MAKWRRLSGWLMASPYFVGGGMWRQLTLRCSQVAPHVFYGMDKVHKSLHLPGEGWSL